MTIRHIQRIKRKCGRVDLYFRKGEFRRGPLKSADNTHELKLEVDAILAEIEAATLATKPVVGTVGGALENYNRSAEFIGLEASTKRDYQYKITELLEDCGDVLLKDVTFGWLKEMQDVWALRGHKACNDRMQVLKNAPSPWGAGAGSGAAASAASPSMPGSWAWTRAASATGGSTGPPRKGASCATNLRMSD
jgi:hypothetical protein